MKRERIKIMVEGKVINTTVVDKVPALWGGQVYIVKINGKQVAVDINQQTIINP